MNYSCYKSFVCVALLSVTFSTSSCGGGGEDNNEGNEPVVTKQYLTLSSQSIKDNEEVDIEVGQVKEKFGTLRFYYYHKDIDTSSNEIRKDIEQIVRKYENHSKFVCEMCGKEGMIRTDIPWIKTLCDDCCKKFE